MLGGIPGHPRVHRPRHRAAPGRLTDPGRQSAGIADSGLRLAGGPAARLLTGFRRASGETRREGLARLSAWARSTEVAACVLPGNAGGLFADLRALGFDDAGPLPRYFAPARPGILRRALTGALLPAPRIPESVEILPEALPAEEERALRERLAPGFGASAEPEAESSPGVHLRRDGEPVASCRIVPGAVAVREWIAPPDEPDLAAALALAVLDAAAAGVSFETTHAVLGRGLLLARFLPRPSRARILVRQRGDRDLPAPRTGDWHLTAPARVGSGGW